MRIMWHKCRKYVVQILRLAGGVIHLSNLNGWTIPYYKSLPGSQWLLATSPWKGLYISTWIHIFAEYYLY